jgi:hypothetical protein
MRPAARSSSNDDLVSAVSVYVTGCDERPSAEARVRSKIEKLSSGVSAVSHRDIAAAAASSSNDNVLDAVTVHIASSNRSPAAVSLVPRKK